MSQNCNYQVCVNTGVLVVRFKGLKAAKIKPRSVFRLM